MAGPNFDADGCPGSGSADVSSLTASLEQCINVTSGSYAFSYRFKGFNSGTNNGLCSVDFYSISCPTAVSDFDFLTGSIDAVQAASSGNWVQAATSPLTPLPAGTKSARISCAPMQGFGYYDQLYFGNSSSVNF